MYEIQDGGIRLDVDESVNACARGPVTVEIQQAILEVEARRDAWNMVDPAFEASAWHAFQAASERLRALLHEAKQGAGRQAG